MRREFLDKATENLESAEMLFDSGKFNASANRAYYAVFHAAIFALSANGLVDENNGHEWVQRTFNGELIYKRKIFSSEFRAYLQEIMSVRLEADYKQSFVGGKVCERQLRKAKELCNVIQTRYAT